MDKEINENIELLKIQVCSAHFHAYLRSQLSFVFALFVALGVGLCTVLWQGLSPNRIILWGGGTIVVIVSTIAYIIIILSGHGENLKKLSEMIETVKQGKELPKLEDNLEFGVKKRDVLSSILLLALIVGLMIIGVTVI